MPDRLGASHRALMSILESRPDLRTGASLEAILRLLSERRSMDLTDLSPDAQAALIASRAQTLLPSTAELAARLSTGRRLVVKFGIDPTASDVHVGHAVPMIVASRFERMGHRVVFIVGDITAGIGDPSGRTTDRPALTPDAIRRNVSTYRDQVSPFFDFDRAGFRFNSEWLAHWDLPRLLAVLSTLPVSAVLQRDDFRNRLAAGQGLTMSELIYSVVMALDSVEIAADVEIGGADQLLNLHMCRRVMEDAGQPPEIIIATELIEGTDGTGAKMSKSRGNFVGLAFPPKDVFGQLMSAPDRLVPGFLRALTELLDPEIDLLGAVHPMDVKTLLAADVTATLHGLESALASRAGFQAQFSRRRLSDTPDLPVVVAADGATVGEALVTMAATVTSLNQVRRVAAGGGLRVIRETPDGASTTVLTGADVSRPLATFIHTPTDGRTFLKCGRVVLEVR